jgi:hypothetical protein
MAIRGKARGGTNGLGVTYRVSDDLAVLYDAFEPVWRKVQTKLFPGT